MSARASILLQEKVKQSEPWNSTRGIYADFSDGFDKPKYYCKCPNCKFVHGHYKTPKEAIVKKFCQLCDARGIEKLKKDIRKVDEPVKRKPVQQPRLWVESLVENLLDPKEFLDRNEPELNTWEVWIPLLKKAGLNVSRRADMIMIKNPATGNYFMQPFDAEPDDEGLTRLTTDFEAEFQRQIGQHIE